jgi:hypothetical protein
MSPPARKIFSFPRRRHQDHMTESFGDFTTAPVQPDIAGEQQRVNVDQRLVDHHWTKLGRFVHVIFRDGPSESRAVGCSVYLILR